MIKVNGIVLKEMKYKDNSKILTIFTRELGKISVLARGVNNPKSKFIANTQVFSQNEYQLFKGKSFYYIQDAYLVDSFYEIRNDIDRMIYGSYILELADKSVEQDQENIKLFDLLEKALEVLSKQENHYLEFILAYELKFISFLGYRPCIHSCVSCNRSGGDHLKFSIKEGGVLCSKCYEKDIFAPKLTEIQYRCMNELLYSKLDELEGLLYKRETIEIIHNLMVDYILVNIDRKYFNSLNILDSLEGF